MPGKYHFDDFFLKSRWICLFAVTSFAVMRIAAMEVMKADSDFGEVILLQNNTVGKWGVLYGEKGIYFEHDSDAKYCTWYGQYFRKCVSYSHFRPTVLTVHHSSQKTFPYGLFKTRFAEKLKHFEMTNIGIGVFHHSGLLGADALNSLNLSHNAFTGMHSRAFTHAKNLIEIDLSYNHIAWMASDVFEVENENKTATTKRLEKIDLSNNELSYLDESVFANMLNLTVLKISHNIMTTIDFIFLATAKKLNYFDISYNHFDGRFHLNVKSNSLSVLNIAGNSYTSFENNLGKMAPNLTTIDVNGNDFNCDDLSLMLIFMHFDHITPIVRSNDGINYEKNVIGIKCKNRQK